MSVRIQSLSEDRRVLRSRAAAVAAARTLFLQSGFAGTTMDDVAESAGLSKRTLYNIYSDKNALFQEVIAEVIGHVEQFAHDVYAEFERMDGKDITIALHELGSRLALAILRPEVIALRRILVSEAASFPELVDDYYKRAPGRVLVALAQGITRLQRSGALRKADPGLAAEQFAYLIAGANLDRAVLLGKVPTRKQITEAAADGAKTFFARYGSQARRNGR